MDADGFAFDELRLKRSGQKDGAASGAAIEQDGKWPLVTSSSKSHTSLVWRSIISSRLRNGCGRSRVLQTRMNERLEQNQRDFLRQTALVELEFGADDDDGAAGIIHALAEQILAEASTLALEHVAQGFFNETIARAGDGAAMTAVVEEGVHGLLQHAFFVADDDFGVLS